MLEKITCYIKRLSLLFALGGLSTGGFFSGTLGGLITIGPSQSIKAALQQMSGGDTLILTAGVYSLDRDIGLSAPLIPSGTSSQKTTIKSAPGAQVMIKPTGGTGVLFIKSNSYISIEGIIFDGTNVGGVVVYVGRQSKADLPATHIDFLGCTFQNSPNHSGLSQWNMDGVPAFWKILNCNAYRNGNKTDSYSPHGLYLGASDVYVQGGEYNDNGSLITKSGHGIHSYAHVSDGHGQMSRNVIIRNVSAQNNQSVGIGIYDCSGGEILSSIASGNLTHGIRVGLRAIQINVKNNRSLSNGMSDIRIDSGAVDNIVENNCADIIVNNGTRTKLANNCRTCCDSTLPPLPPPPTDVDVSPITPPVPPSQPPGTEPPVYLPLPPRPRPTTAMDIDKIYVPLIIPRNEPAPAVSGANSLLATAGLIAAGLGLGWVFAGPEKGRKKKK